MTNLEKLITGLRTLKEDVASCCAFSGPSTAQLAPYPVPLASDVMKKKKPKKVKIDENIDESFIATIKTFLIKSLAEENEAIAAYLQRADECRAVGLTLLADLFTELAEDETTHKGCLLGALEHLGFADTEEIIKGKHEYMELVVKDERKQEPDSKPIH